MLTQLITYYIGICFVYFAFYQYKIRNK